MVAESDTGYYMASVDDIGNGSIEYEGISKNRKTNTKNNINLNKSDNLKKDEMSRVEGVENQYVNPIYETDPSDNVVTSNNNELHQHPPPPPRENSEVLYNPTLRFGWKCLSPKFFQLINRPAFFLFFLCFGGIAQGFVVTGIAFTVLTSIEKQFGLKSSEVALFGTAYDTAYGVCCIFVGYIGHAHKPRCIGWGLVVMVMGSILLSIPKFAIGTYYAGVARTTDYCQKNVTSTDVTCSSPQEWYYEFMFILGNVLLGIGATPLYTLAPAHIDEVTRRGQGSLFMGIYYAACAIGPALGFIIGMPVLNAWVDIVQPLNSSLTPEDTNWVGAWWLGYLIGAGLLLLPVIPLLGFPKEFPDAEILRAHKKELEDTIEEDQDLKHDLKSVWPATKALFRNPPYIFISLASAAESLAIGGFSTFIPKFVQTQFHFTASDSALYTGIIVIPGAAGGIFIGGYLAKRFNWNCKQTLKGACVMAFIATLFVTAGLVGCSGRTVEGMNGNATENMTAFITKCNRDCHCSREFYKPICSVEDQKTYYSPCHAGCSKDNLVTEGGGINGEKGMEAFYNCTCFSAQVTKAVRGRCTSDCTLFPLFVVLAFLLMFFTFMNNVPIINATFRVVNEGQGSFAMGFQQIFVRFLGFIPAPVLFGALIDKSCNLWQEDACTGETTSCLEYDQPFFRYYMFILGVVTKFASFVFIFIAYKLYNLPESKAPTPPTESNDDYNLKQVPNNDAGFSYSYDNNAIAYK